MMARLPRDPWARTAGRFVAAAALGTLIALVFEDAIVHALLPVMRAWLLVVDGSYLTLDLAIVADHGEAIVRRIAAPLGVQAIDGHVLALAAQSRLASAASAGLVLQPLVLGFALIAAFPARDALELALRAVCALLLLGLVVLLDVPMLLYGYAWYEESGALAPERHFSPLVAWGDAMNAGGRFALTFIAAVASTAVAGRLRRARPHPAAPSARPPR